MKSLQIKCTDDRDKSDVLIWSGGSTFRRRVNGKEVLGFTAYSPKSYKGEAPSMLEALDIMRDHFELIDKCEKEGGTLK